MKGCQAKVLSSAQISAVRGYFVEHHGVRFRLRNRVMFDLSLLAGLRSSDIAGLRWKSVLEGNMAASTIRLEAGRTKLKMGGEIPLHPSLKANLKLLFEEAGRPDLNQSVIITQSGRTFTAQEITSWFFALFKKLGFAGCSSHSGRRTFITNLARRISLHGGSIRDVQRLARHRSLQTTSAYIAYNEGAAEAAVAAL